ncbi:hypothetical protein CBL_12100 [Carabus blaptoides fortunei]
MRWVLTKDKTWATVTSPKPEPVTCEQRCRTSTSGRQEPHITAVQDMASRVQAAGARIDLDEEISALFLSLPASYDNVVSGLESRDEDTLTMKLVVGKLLDEFTRRVECRTSEGNGDAMFAKPWRQPGQAHQGYRKGYSSHKGGNSASSTSKACKSEKECYYCNKKGHFEAECRKRQKNFANSGGKSKEAASKVEAKAAGNRGGDHSLIMERASIVSEANTSNKWLVDSGCSSHMTSNRNLFNKLKTTKRVVQLAGRDHSIPVTGIGTRDGEVYLHAKVHNGLFELEWLGKAAQTPGKHEPPTPRQPRTRSGLGRWRQTKQGMRESPASLANSLGILRRRIILLSTSIPQSCASCFCIVYRNLLKLSRMLTSSCTSDSRSDAAALKHIVGSCNYFWTRSIFPSMMFHKCNKTRKLKFNTPDSNVLQLLQPY